MKTLLIMFLMGLMALFILKVVGGVLLALLPIVVLLGLLAIPLGFIILVGWGVMALLRPARQESR
jgi:hypothetical protein